MKSLRYAKRLIGFDSTSSKTNRMIAKYMEMKLTKHGFVVEKLEYIDAKKVRKVNLIAKKGGGQGGLAYFCHNDVVPAKKWFTKKYSAFEPVVAQERLYGRGSCDMKGSIACMLAAAQQYAWDDLKHPFYFVCTADEEVGYKGAKQIVRESKHYREMVNGQTKAIIGEPTQLEVVHAHKGSLEIRAIATGVAAHSSTRNGVNANLKMIPFLTEMKKIHDEIESDPKYQNPLFDPPSLSWNIGIRDDAHAINVTAGKSKCTVYVRPMPNIDLEPLLQRVQNVANECELDLEINRWGDPMYVPADSEFVEDALKLVHRPKPKTVSFGTDGGVFTELENKIVFGPGNIAQAHTVKEWISLEQLSRGTDLYSKMIRHWCC